LFYDNDLIGIEEKTMSNTDFWASRREATLNWLALGLLLAAWNATDNDGGTDTRPRPETLRSHPHVTVRAALLAVSTER
jgi:hypothetical protein